MIDPVRCYQLYLSVKTHFTTEKYDCIKHNGRVAHASFEQFERRKDRALFSYAAKKFENPQQAASYFVANFIENNDYPIEDFDKGWNNYMKWQKIRQSMTKTFKDDLDFLEFFLEENDIEFEDILFENSTLPPLYTLAKTGKISYPTITILDKYADFIPVWNKQFPVWKKEFLRVQKLGSFLKIDEAKYFNLIQERHFKSFTNETL